jgi:hypothetical protein
MFTTLLGSPMISMHEATFRIYSALRRKSTKKTMRKDKSFRYGILNIGLI